MARGVNKVILVGNLGSDPEVRYLPNGNAVANLAIATSEAWKDKQTGEKQERTEWHRVVCFSRLGEIVGEYARKGAKVYVEGSLRTRKWQDAQGQDRYSTEIVASDVQLLDSKGAASGFQPQPPLSAYEDSSQAYTTTSAAPQAKAQPTAETATQGGTFDELDDDIPF